MACHFLPNGAIICTRGRRAPDCRVCRKRPASKLCDHRGRDGRLCSLPMCASCATSGGHDVDFCPAHASAGEQRALL